MAIHWQIPFKSRRTSVVYTVNIYDSTYTGNAIVLKGGAQPFTTQEDDNDDQFTPVRTQTGYIRIVDDGKDANGNTWNWKTILPSTDTDRPVTLTDGSNNVVWQGFMQAQNFGGVLYGNPQEREFPVQCALTTLQGTDINYTQKEIQNFAYLLDYIVSSLPTISIDNIYIQGGADAQSWLLKRIDWQNFVDVDSEGNLSARYNLYQCLEDMCRFWGWTARTHKKNLYLTRADDTTTTFLALTRAQLTTMAGGNTAGTTNGTFSTVTLSGDIFASVNNNDYRQRGPNKATVKANGNTGDTELVRIFPNSVVDAMTAGGTYLVNGGGFGGSSGNGLRYTNDITSFDASLLSGRCESTYATFNVMSTTNGEPHNVIKVLKSFTSTSATPYASLYTVYEHVFSGGMITISGTIYRGGDLYQNYGDGEVGSEHMYMRVGIGKTRGSAVWYAPTGGLGPDRWGNAWSSTMTTFKVTIGNKEDVLAQIVAPTKCSGLLFVDILGSDDLSEVSGQRSFDLADFMVTCLRNNKYYEITTNEYGNFAGIKTKVFSDTREYKSENQNNVRQDWNADCIYASDNDMSFGYGVLINADDGYMIGYNYGGLGLLTYPEQHLANRVTAYWASAKRKIEAELRSNASIGTNVTVADITPQYKVTLDSTTTHPISISREWRDDVIKLTLLEM